MRIRMVPISQIFSRFPRLVRDLSRSLNKKIDLVIEGEDTELDKSVIEDLLDPLIHCVRNSIDHGIEDPEGRSEAGKEPVGTVSLRASNEGNMILIEVIDDGRGIDVDAVRKKAIDRGVIHPNKQLSDVEAFNLIFDPGFSTAREITDVSGRGVGLDVVKRQIEKLNGSVTVWSERGAGTRVHHQDSTHSCHHPGSSRSSRERNLRDSDYIGNRQPSDQAERDQDDRQLRGLQRQRRRCLAHSAESTLPDSHQRKPHLSLRRHRRDE
jgi:two-component sensor histidine kinase